MMDVISTVFSIVGIIILILLVGGIAKLLLSASGCLIELLIVSIKAIIAIAFIIAFLSLLFWFLIFNTKQYEKIHFTI